ncbi:hypothetical protein D1610_14720 [Sphingomonas gilva]|uniref:Uncharacterized protein n=2 Tax=Sphingomonas gilva TaxID=2305907 RepID=A0A396RK87_9SPHN|nr:hypothetical protein D1610_14720 [Sphingomonas gilva]
MMGLLKRWRGRSRSAKVVFDVAADVKHEDAATREEAAEPSTFAAGPPSYASLLSEFTDAELSHALAASERAEDGNITELIEQELDRRRATGRRAIS